MALLEAIRRFIWLAAVILGLMFIGAGAYMVSEGLSAKNDVRDTLVAEQVTTAKDASIPNVPVDDSATALSQANIIREHSLTTTGGKTYAQLPRDDPNRAVYLDGVTLRTALTQAYMGFKVADLVMGVGVIVLVVGATNVFLLAPVLFWARGGAPQEERLAARKPTPPRHEPAPFGP